jgi:TatD DNase family protein
VTNPADALPDTGSAARPAVSDSHCHLADEAYLEDLDAVVARAHAANVVSALCILSADDAAELGRVPKVQVAWPAVRFAAAVHPHRAGAYEGHAADAAAVTRAAVEAVGARAIGEIGLDYHYDFAPRAVQQEVFAAQVALALELDLPVIIHMREAAEDTAAILRAAGPTLGGVMHCFSGTREDARRALDLGFLLSLSGILTFPRAGALREIATFVPADRLLVETDAPYLAPVPHRGRRNEPAWVQRTVQTLAETRGEPVADLAARLEQTFTRFVGHHGRH